jgi:hypothetical protein
MSLEAKEKTGNSVAATADWELGKDSMASTWWASMIAVAKSLLPLTSQSTILQPVRTVDTFLRFGHDIAHASCVSVRIECGEVRDGKG